MTSEIHTYKEWWVIHADTLRGALFRVYHGMHPEEVWLGLVIETEMVDADDEGEEE